MGQVISDLPGWIGVLGIHADQRRAVAAVVELRLSRNPRDYHLVRQLADTIAKQLCTFSVRYTSRADVPSDVLAQEEARIRSGISHPNATYVERVVDAQLTVYFRTHCLLEQSLLDDSSRTVGALLDSVQTSEGYEIEIGMTHVHRTSNPAW